MHRKAKAENEVMALLPISQVSVDVGGPFLIAQGRGRMREKCWVCLFTCLLCRARQLFEMPN